MNPPRAATLGPTAAAYATAAAAAYGLKAYFSSANADALRWVLAPTCWLASRLGGIAFVDEAGAGFISHSERLVVGPACSGLNFLIICFAALFQAVTLKLWKVYNSNMSWRLYRRSLLNENKSRAARFGIGGKLIDFGKREEVEFDALLDELLEFVDDVVDELGSRNEVYYAREIVKQKPGADRQLAAYEQRKDLRDVVDYIISETEAGTT